MRRFLRRWLAGLLLAWVLCLPAAAQQPAPAPAPPAERTERGAPALQYMVAVLSAMLVLVVLCMPSRKA